MTIRQIREYLEVRPLQPIVIRTVSGARHAVKHPDYLFIPPVGDIILVVDPDGLMHHIDLDYVDAVAIAPKRRKSTKP